jgi:hypothetical protein
VSTSVAFSSFQEEVQSFVELARRLGSSCAHFVNNTLPNNNTMDRDGNVYMAKLAEQVKTLNQVFI